MSTEADRATIDDLHDEVAHWRGKEEAQRRRAVRAEADLEVMRSNAASRGNCLSELARTMQEYGYID